MFFCERRMCISWFGAPAMSSSRWLIHPGTMISGGPDLNVATARLTLSCEEMNWICCCTAKEYHRCRWTCPYSVAQAATKALNNGAESDRISGRSGCHCTPVTQRRSICCTASTYSS